MAEAVAARAGERNGRARPPASPLPLQQAVGHMMLVELAERALIGGPPVTVVEWPVDGSRLADLRRMGLPRLVAVRPHDDPVLPTDELEDWIRLPADDGDVRARLTRLRESARRRPPWPVVDGAGRIIFGGRWVAVSHVEERLAALLVERFGKVVRHDELLAAGWPGRTDRTILRPVMSRLRHRLEPLGLDLASIRDVGYALGRRDPPDR